MQDVRPRALDPPIGRLADGGRRSASGEAVGRTRAPRWRPAAGGRFGYRARPWLVGGDQTSAADRDANGPCTYAGVRSRRAVAAAEYRAPGHAAYSGST